MDVINDKPAYKLNLALDQHGNVVDGEGTIIALAIDNNSVDPVDRCGIGLVSLDPEHPFTAACKKHDFIYSSPAAQDSYSRKEADDMLYKDLRTTGATKFTAWGMWFAARLFGGLFWEGKK